MANDASPSQKHSFDLAAFSAEDHELKRQQFWIRVSIAVGLPLVFVATGTHVLAETLLVGRDPTQGVIVLGIGLWLAVIVVADLYTIPKYRRGPRQLSVDEDGVTLLYENGRVSRHTWMGGRFFAKIVDFTGTVVDPDLKSSQTLEIRSRHRWLPSLDAICLLPDGAASAVIAGAAAHGLRIDTRKGSTMMYGVTPVVHTIQK